MKTLPCIIQYTRHGSTRRSTCFRSLFYVIPSEEPFFRDAAENGQILKSLLLVVQIIRIRANELRERQRQRQPQGRDEGNTVTLSPIIDR